jgi:hypothetical protein
LVAHNLASHGRRLNIGVTIVVITIISPPNPLYRCPTSRRVSAGNHTFVVAYAAGTFTDAEGVGESVASVTIKTAIPGTASSSSSGICITSFPHDPREDAHRRRRRALTDGSTA